MTKRLVFVLCAVLAAGACGAQAGKGEDDLITVKLRVVNKASATWNSASTKSTDTLSVTFTETAVYRVTSRPAHGTMPLELVSYQSQAMVGGGGAQFSEGIEGPITDRLPNPCKWKYVGRQPSRSLAGLSLNSDGRGGVWAPLNLWEEFVEPIEYDAAFLAVAGMFHCGDLETCPVAKALKFTFPAEWKTLQVARSATEVWPITVGENEKIGAGDLSVDYSISGGPPSDVEAIITPDKAYAGWVPAFGPTAEQPGGTPLGFTVELKSKKNPGQPVKQTAWFQFELVDTSQEPGRCLNSLDVGTDPDLKIMPQLNREMATVYPSGQSADSKKGLKKSKVLVSSLDSGAYGALRVTAYTSDKNVLVAHLQGDDEALEFAIPQDKNDNQIADAWEAGEKGLGKDLPATWDEESDPPLDGTAGDGLTLYEEYRGLVHKGAELRLSGTQKDLVIVNEIGGKAQAGLKLFESASGIKVRELDAGELRDNRIVNVNTATGTGGAQCALRLVEQALGEDIGMSLPDRPKKSPRNCDLTAINSDLSFLPAEALVPMLTMGIAHELGHSVGVQHHGDSAPGLIFKDLTISDPATKIYGSEAEITQRPYKLSGLIESKASGGECSGPQTCIMRTPSLFQWVRRMNNMGKASYYAVPPTPVGSIFCQDPAGTGINAAGNLPISYFGNSKEGRGACLTHMRVKDW